MKTGQNYRKVNGSYVYGKFGQVITDLALVMTSICKPLEECVCMAPCLTADRRHGSCLLQAVAMLLHLFLAFQQTQFIGAKCTVSFLLGCLALTLCADDGMTESMAALMEGLQAPHLGLTLAQQNQGMVAADLHLLCRLELSQQLCWC